MENYICYYELHDGCYRIINSKTEIIETVERLPWNISTFYLTKPYDATSEDLLRYCKDILIASEQLKTNKLIKNFDYIQPYKKTDGTFKYQTHGINIERLFKITCKGKYEDHEPITPIEASYFDRCNNGGLTYCCEEGTYNCFGYDFSNYYASILASTKFIIPFKEGKECHMNKLPPKIKFGFYNINITSNDARFNKIFAFSKHNIYTSYDIRFCLELIEKYNFDIKMELNQTIHNNAYIYKLDNQTSGNKIFDRWYNTILVLKKEYPKNILIKMMSSSLWGHLQISNIKYLPEEEAEKLDIGMNGTEDYNIVNYVYKEDGKSYYKLRDNKKPYKYNIRLKPFITAMGRIKTAKVALMNLDKVIRIHTDGVVFSEPQEFYIDNFIPENKTTGLIHFKNVNNYQRVDS